MLRRLICMFSIAALAAAGAAPAGAAGRARGAGAAAPASAGIGAAAPFTSGSAAADVAGQAQNPATAGQAQVAAAGQARGAGAGQAQGAAAGQASGPAAGASAADGAAGNPPGNAGSAAGAGQAKAAVGPPPEPVHQALGQDMARYYMVFLRRSGKPLPPAAEARKIMEGHMDNIRRLAGERKLLLAGPFMDQSGPGSLAGIFILSTASAEEAQKLVDSDPAVAAGRFTVEIVPWMGPKTLARVLEP